MIVVLKNRQLVLAAWRRVVVRDLNKRDKLLLSISQVDFHVRVLASFFLHKKKTRFVFTGCSTLSVT